MYKFIGCLLVFFTVVLIFYRKCTVYYCTCRYLEYILKLIEDMKIACMYGKTYKSVFENFENMTEKDLVFKICSELCSDKQKIETDMIISNAGKRIREKEEKYLEFNRQLIIEKSKENMIKFKENSKISLLSGLYTAVVLILLIV